MTTADQTSLVEPNRPGTPIDRKFHILLPWGDVEEITVADAVQELLDANPKTNDPGFNVPGYRAALFLAARNGIALEPTDGMLNVEAIYNKRVKARHADHLKENREELDTILAKGWGARISSGSKINIVICERHGNNYSSIDQDGRIVSITTSTLEKALSGTGCEIEPVSPDEMAHLRQSKADSAGDAAYTSSDSSPYSHPIMDALDNGQGVTIQFKGKTLSRFPATEGRSSAESNDWINAESGDPVSVSWVRITPKHPFSTFCPKDIEGGRGVFG